MLGDGTRYDMLMHQEGRQNTRPQKAQKDHHKSLYQIRLQAIEHTPRCTLLLSSLSLTARHSYCYVYLSIAIVSVV